MEHWELHRYCGYWLLSDVLVIKMSNKTAHTPVEERKFPYWGTLKPEEDADFVYGLLQQIINQADKVGMPVEYYLADIAYTLADLADRYERG